MSSLIVDELESLATGRTVSVDNIDTDVRKDLANPDKGGDLVHVTTSTGTQTVAEALDRRGPVFDNVADMQAEANITLGIKVRTLGYYSLGDGGGNDYEIVSAGTGTDDGGEFIDLSGSGLQARRLNLGADVLKPVHQYKKHLVHTFPRVFVGYSDAKDKYPQSPSLLAPQSFFIDEKDNIIYITHSGGIHAAYDWITGSHVSTFYTEWDGDPSLNASEGCYVWRSGSSKFLITKKSEHILAKYDITNMPANLSTVNSVEEMTGEIHYQFFVSGDFIYVEQRNVRRQVFRKFDLNDFTGATVGSITFPVSGKSSNNMHPKRQGMEAGPGFYVGGYGPTTIDGSDPGTQSNYQGISVFDSSGTGYKDYFAKAQDVINLLHANNIPADRIENEGCHVSPDGRIYSMFITEGNTEQGGITIWEEFSKDFRAIDFTPILQNGGGFLSERGKWFPSVIYNQGGYIINPVDGTELQSFGEIAQFMVNYDIHETTFNTSDFTGVADFANNPMSGGRRVTLFRRDNYSSDTVHANIFSHSANVFMNDSGIYLEQRFNYILRPVEDNRWPVGSSNLRPSDIFAANGTINTSDTREKQQQRDLSDAETAVAQQLRGMIRAFKWSSAVGTKGDAARWHFGVMAQEVAEVFSQHGLSAYEYGLFCYDEWDAELDDDGNEITPAGNRYGVRYDQLLAFIISAL